MMVEVFGHASTYIYITKMALNKGTYKLFDHKLYIYIYIYIYTHTNIPVVFHYGFLISFAY